MAVAASARSRSPIAFLGPPGTFTEEALLSQADLADGESRRGAVVTRSSRRSRTGDVDLGFVALENSIEGTVNAIIDASSSTTTC